MKYHMAQDNYDISTMWFLSVSKRVEEGTKQSRMPKVSPQRV